MSKSQEYGNCHEPLSQDTDPSKNMLHKTKHTSSSIRSYMVGLDPVATSYLVGWIERTRSIPG